MKKPLLSHPTFLSRIIQFFVLAGILFPVPVLAQQQQREKILQYAVANEYLFWKQVAQHYPLTSEQIHRYNEQLSFYILSGNKQLHWTPTLIAEFASQWTGDILRNPAIPWDQTLIDQFKDASWFDWDYITQHGNLLVSKDFFKKYESAIRHVHVADSLHGTDSVWLYANWPVFHPPALFEGFLLDHAYDHRPRPASLLAHLSDSIQDVPVDTIIKYNNWINKYKFSSCEKCIWSFSSFEKIFPLLAHGDLYRNKIFYKTLFAGIIDDTFIEEVYQKQFPPDELRFYSLEKGPDSMGILPTIQFKRKPYLSFEDKMGLTVNFPDTLLKSNFILANSGEPPLRFADYLEFWQHSHQSGIIAIFISSRFKSILDKSVMPPHRFYPIIISIDDPLYGQASMPYHVLLLDYSSLDEIIDEKLQLIYQRSMFKHPITIHDTTYHAFFDRPDYRYFLDSLRHQQGYDKVTVPKVYMDTYYDLFAAWPGRILVSPRLKKKLEEADITGIKMTVYDGYTIAHIMKDKAPHRFLHVPKMPLVNPLRDQPTIRNFKAAIAKRDAILHAPRVVADLYARSKISIYPVSETQLIHRDSMLRCQEIQWDVQLPAKYRDALIRKKLPSLKPDYDGYYLFDIDRIEQLDENWHEQYPKMVKGAMVGSDGTGNYLHLLLEQGSTYKLGSMVYITGHESIGPQPLFDMDEKIK